MPSNHLIFCHPLLLLPSVFPSTRVFSSESALCIRWPKYWSFSFSISLSNDYWFPLGLTGLISLQSKGCSIVYRQIMFKDRSSNHLLHVSSRRRQWRPTPVLLPGKSHGRRSLVGCSPWGRWESDMTERLHFHSSLSCIGEGNGNPLQCSCLENPRDGEAWWAAVSGVTQSRTRLKRLSSSSSSTWWYQTCFYTLYHPLPYPCSLRLTHVLNPFPGKSVDKSGSMERFW